MPLVWALLDGERPSALALVGVAIALVSIVLVAGAPEHDDHTGATVPLVQVIPPAMASGLGFGAVFVLLGETSSDAGLWPLLVARPVAVALTAAAALVLVRRDA